MNVQSFHGSGENYDFTQEYLAQYLTCSQSAYSRLKFGGRQLSIDYLIKLLTLYPISMDY
ncbi:helix-turn-helix domain-containing protein [Streptococcus hongkongensis]